ncbi:hypothetical protein JR316_0005859 [Psilocybe cubensis]|uniref:CCHC-type domain-containing protein n=2 Tax=Psilocybe cubensis TaxID=181762 RepID=A0A8H7Y349_PSICU|nr:hypothetical protein JR316_0005859 [Psilocybe cubensis]KAH9481337.1 hypothetical protein JR316_0005859 [Psilocybe cubensis]
MATRGATLRSGRAPRGHTAARDVPTTGSDRDPPASRGDDPKQEALPTGMEEGGARGRDDHRGNNPNNTGSAAAAARRARRSLSLNSFNRYMVDTEINSVYRSSVNDAQTVVTETKELITSLMDRLSRIENAINMNGSIFEVSRAPEDSDNSHGREESQEIAIDNDYLQIQEMERKLTEMKKAYTRRYQSIEVQPKTERRGISTTPMSHDVEDLITQAARQQTQARRTEAIKPSNQLPAESLLGQLLANPKGNSGKEHAELSARALGPLDTEGHIINPARFKPLPPTAPDKYHGDADFMKFYKYITQCDRFCKEAALPPQDQVVKCADYLAGKAYKFYSTMVSISVDSWDRQRFFTELYNYCFPPDYRLKQRKKLEKFSQGSMTVAEYAAELLILFRIVGKSTPSQRVDRLWNGLKPELQSALWKEGLDYEQNTWDEVIRIATRYEVAHEIERNQRQYIKYNKQYYVSGKYDYKTHDNNYGVNNDDEPSDSDHGQLSSGGTDDDSDQDKEDKVLALPQDSNVKASGYVRNAQIKCYRCGKTGHIGRHCRNVRRNISSTYNESPSVSNRDRELDSNSENEHHGATDQTASGLGSYFMEVEVAMCDIADTGLNTDIYSYSDHSAIDTTASQGTNVELSELHVNQILVSEDLEGGWTQLAQTVTAQLQDEDVDLEPEKIATSLFDADSLVKQGIECQKSCPIEFTHESGDISHSFGMPGGRM